MTTVLMALMIIGGYFNSWEICGGHHNSRESKMIDSKSEFQRLNPKATKVEPIMYKIIISIDFYVFCVKTIKYVDIKDTKVRPSEKK